MKCILIEENAERKLVSLNELKNFEHFWTVDCASYSSANSLIKEVKSTNSSSLALLNTIYGSENSLTKHIDILFCNHSSEGIINKLKSDHFQVDYIKVIPEQRRIDLRWAVPNVRIWEEINLIREEYSPNRFSKCYVQILDIDIDSNLDHIAINSGQTLFLLKNSELNTFLVDLINKLSNKTKEDKIALSRIIVLFDHLFYGTSFEKGDIDNYIDSITERTNYRDIDTLIWSRVDKQKLTSIILRTDFKVYDPAFWNRRDLY